jgi:hypothetical protein
MTNPHYPIPSPQSPIPSPQSPIPSPQSPIPNHTNIFKEIAFLVQQFGISEKVDKE